jgi:hypothetical protein
MAVLTKIESALHTLEQLRQQLLSLKKATLEKTQNESAHNHSSNSFEKESRSIAWGAKVSETFKARVLWIADALDCSPDDLMACMHWESGGTFRADIKNAAGSGATGLIQFMPSTARGLGTTVALLAKMSAEDQLRYVYEYFKPFAGRLNNLGDLYMAILWPKGVGKPDHFVLFDKAKTPTTFRQNAGLDVNKDGLVTRAECLVKVNERLARGLLKENMG